MIEAFQSAGVVAIWVGLRGASTHGVLGARREIAPLAQRLGLSRLRQSAARHLDSTLTGGPSGRPKFRRPRRVVTAPRPTGIYGGRGRSNRLQGLS